MVNQNTNTISVESVICSDIKLYDVVSDQSNQLQRLDDLKPPKSVKWKGVTVDTVDTILLAFSKVKGIHRGLEGSERLTNPFPNPVSSTTKSQRRWWNLRLWRRWLRTCWGGVPGDHQAPRDTDGATATANLGEKYRELGNMHPVLQDRQTSKRNCQRLCPTSTS